MNLGIAVFDERDSSSRALVVGFGHLAHVDKNAERHRWRYFMEMLMEDYYDYEYKAAREAPLTIRGEDCCLARLVMANRVLNARGPVIQLSSLFQPLCNVWRIIQAVISHRCVS